MDITQHLRVIRRWHKVLIASALLGLILAGLFMARVSSKGVEYRRPQKWQSVSTLFVTQRGFPWGRTTLPGTDGTDAPPALDPKAQKALQQQPGGATSFANPQRLSLLAVIYSFLSQSNTIGQINKQLPPGGEVTAQELSNNTSGALPLFTLTATAQTAADATKLNVDRTQALMKYLADQQNANQVPAGQRVEVSVMNRPAATRVSGHGLMLAAALLFLALVAGLAACYMLESLRLSRERGREAVGEIVAHRARSAR